MKINRALSLGLAVIRQAQRCCYDCGDSVLSAYSRKEIRRSKCRLMADWELA